MVNSSDCARRRRQPGQQFYAPRSDHNQQCTRRLRLFWKYLGPLLPFHVFRGLVAIDLAALPPPAPLWHCGSCAMAVDHRVELTITCVGGFASLYRPLACVDVEHVGPWRLAAGRVAHSGRRLAVCLECFGRPVAARRWRYVADHERIPRHSEQPQGCARRRRDACHSDEGGRRSGASGSATRASHARSRRQAQSSVFILDNGVIIRNASGNSNDRTPDAGHEFGAVFAGTQKA